MVYAGHPVVTGISNSTATFQRATLMTWLSFRGILLKGEIPCRRKTLFFFRGKSRSSVCIHLMAVLIIVQTAYMHDLLLTD